MDEVDKANDETDANLSSAYETMEPENNKSFFNRNNLNVIFDIFK